jgi:hypothetical protein
MRSCAATPPACQRPCSPRPRSPRWSQGSDPQRGTLRQLPPIRISTSSRCLPLRLSTQARLAHTESTGLASAETVVPMPPDSPFGRMPRNVPMPRGAPGPPPAVSHFAVRGMRRRGPRLHGGLQLLDHPRFAAVPQSLTLEVLQRDLGVHVPRVVLIGGQLLEGRVLVVPLGAGASSGKVSPDT